MNALENNPISLIRIVVDIPLFNFQNKLKIIDKNNETEDSNHVY